MQFVFLDMAGKTIFARDDAERAEWSTEEMSLDLDFPYVDGKVVSIGQRIFFVDPSTGEHQIYEVKTAKTIEPDHFQQITAENIAISELSDEHMDSVELTDVTASEALQTVINGTLWNIGVCQIDPQSSGDLSRGSVWQAILQIRDNWNVYIIPRVGLTASGAIGRFLDIISPDGTWNGIRLSVDKNIVDPTITFDDSEVATALYGYGGTIVAETPEGENTEVDFADVVWEATDEHPAKPAGQKYLENPAATAEYGRDGRARFGFFQNSEITDPETLLEKTWESLKNASTPAVSFEGTVEDLRRFGYADQPLRLHDIALVEILPAGFKKQLQIIRMTVDLLDPSSTVLTIGSYIPNIIYIQRETNENATGVKGGGKNKSKTTNAWKEFRTTVTQYADGSGMQIKAVQNDVNNQAEEIAVQSGRIDVAYNKITLEVEDRRNADGVLSSKITQTATEIRLEVNNEIDGVNSRITQTADSIRSEVNDTKNGLQSQITQTATQIRSEVSNSVSGLQSSITQTATQIRSEVSSSVSGLQSSIDQQANKISLVVQDDGQGGNEVNAAQIVMGINNQDTTSQSYVNIQADRVNLSGYVTASSLDATNANISNLVNGTTTAAQINATILKCPTKFVFRNHEISLISVTINNTKYTMMGLYGWTS